MIPKFSIRQLLWGMVAIGVLSLCMSSAARGSRVAFGISVAVVGAFIPLLVYAVVHWASFAIANFMRLIAIALASRELLVRPIAVPERVQIETQKPKSSAVPAGESIDEIFGELKK